MYRIPKINADLRRYSLWKNLKYLLSFVVYVALWTFAFVFYYQRRYASATPWTWWMFLLFGVAVFASGWLICCMSRFLFDKSLVGKITGERYVRNYGRGLSRKAAVSVDFHDYVKISVITENGKKRKATVPLFDDGYDGYYRSGGTLVKFRGLNYPLCMESEAEGTHLCSVCGVRTYYKEGKAIHGEAEPQFADGVLVFRCCGKTMINTDDIINEGV